MAIATEEFSYIRQGARQAGWAEPNVQFSPAEDDRHLYGDPHAGLGVQFLHKMQHLVVIYFKSTKA